jgi:membrane protease YdiL (CAAX protease family)
MTKHSSIHFRFFYGVVLPALFFQFLGAFLYFIVLEGLWAQCFYTLTKILLVVWPLIFWKALPPLRRSPHKKSTLILWGIGWGGVLGLPIVVTFEAFRDFWTTFSPLMAEKIQDLNLAEHYIVFSLFLSLIHSLIEEVYWRGFVFRGLQMKLAMIPAAVVSSIAFASHHYLVLSQFFSWPLVILMGTLVGGAGFVWCLLYSKTKSLLPSWLSHACVDMVVMGLGYVLVF